MNKDKLANDLYDLLDSDIHTFYRNFRWQDPHTGEIIYAQCSKCSGLIEYAYLENRLYAIRCNGCDCIRLVKAPSPKVAVQKSCHFGWKVS